MKRGNAIACLAVMTIFCSLPHVIGMAAPSLAIPGAQLASLVCVGGAFFAFRHLRSRPSRFGFLPLYALASAATLLSSISWFGIPFVDAVFMVTAVASAIALLGQIAMLVATAARNRRNRSSLGNGEA